MKITAYNAICNLGNNIDEIYEKAINGDVYCFSYSKDYIKGQNIRIGSIKCSLPEIKEIDFNIRANQFILKTLSLMENEINEILKKYDRDRIAVIGATTNSGVEEFEKTNNKKHYEIGNISYFTHKLLNLKGFHSTVSTACSSGLRAFSLCKNLINNNVTDASIIVCSDSVTKVPIFGFNSLEILSDKQSLPFSKNRCGMNLGEGCAIFIVEKESDKGINVLALGDTSDVYHPTTPDPNAKEGIRGIKIALQKANLKPSDIDYINLHGTGTISNDIMEAKAIYEVFKNEVPASSTKQMTGHLLGAAAGIETALCCKLLDNFKGRLYPHIYDDNYDETLPFIQLTKKDKIYKKCEKVMCNSFGFGGCNSIMILGK